MLLLVAQDVVQAVVGLLSLGGDDVQESCSFPSPRNLIQKNVQDVSKPLIQRSTSLLSKMQAVCRGIAFYKKIAYLVRGEGGCKQYLIQSAIPGKSLTADFSCETIKVKLLLTI